MLQFDKNPGKDRVFVKICQISNHGLTICAGPVCHVHSQRGEFTGRVVPCDGTEVYFTKPGGKSSLVGEQFWGRAVQASRDSEESGALFLGRGGHRREQLDLAGRIPFRLCRDHVSKAPRQPGRERAVEAGSQMRKKLEQRLQSWPIKVISFD